MGKTRGILIREIIRLVEKASASDLEFIYAYLRA